jgi:probable HAF family extracellular repeat protein
MIRVCARRSPMVLTALVLLAVVLIATVPALLGCGGGGGGANGGGDGNGGGGGTGGVTYSITDLGTLGGTGSYAKGLNSSGQVVGYSYMAGNQVSHAFLYDGGTMHDLGTLGGTNSFASAINDSGQAVGRSHISNDAAEHAFLHDGTTMHDLGTLPGCTRSDANDINAAGHVVGSSCAAVLYDGTTMHELTTPGLGAIPEAINDHGQVVGQFQVASGLYHAFLLDVIGARDLGTLGGTIGHAYDINAAGHVVGRSHIANDAAEHAFLYDGTTMHDLGTLGGTHSEASAINDSGYVVGQSLIAGDDRNHAFLYDGTTMRDLNDHLAAGSSGWTLADACDIHNNGQIVGCGYRPDGQLRAYLATPQ